MKKFLEVLLPQQTPLVFRAFSHQGKSDLKNSIAKKLRALNAPDVTFVILIDQDSNNCHALKAEIQAICHTVPQAQCVVRIVCHELEAWYLGDLTAVDIAFGKNMARHQDKKSFRDPDNNTPNAKQLLHKYIGTKKQIDTAEKMANAMSKTSIAQNRSYSFQVFIKTLPFPLA